MEYLIVAIILSVGFAAGVGAMYLWLVGKKKPARKKPTPWLTAKQLVVLDVIRQRGRSGLLLWHTDINLATIRSLAKRGFCDTAPGGRIVITRAGSKCLLESRPPEQTTGDQKNRSNASDPGVSQDDPAGSQAVSDHA